MNCGLSLRIVRRSLLIRYFDNFIYFFINKFDKEVALERLDEALSRCNPSEEEVERARSNQHGYVATAGTAIPALVGSTVQEVYGEMLTRINPQTGRSERCYSVGFQSDGLVAAGMPHWRSKVLCEVFIEVFHCYYVIFHQRLFSLL